MKSIATIENDNSFDSIKQIVQYFECKGINFYNRMNFDFTLEQLAVLGTIYENKNISQSRVSSIVHCKRSYITQILYFLEKKELIDIFIGAKNNKVMRKFIITRKGRETVEKTMTDLYLYTHSIDEIEN